MSEEGLGWTGEGESFLRALWSLHGLQAPPPPPLPSQEDEYGIDKNTRSQKVEYYDPPIDDVPQESSSPLGLNLRKSPSLVNLIEERLSKKKIQSSDDDHVTPPIPGRLKASNIPATLLRIGHWKRVSQYEGDVVAKVYFAKKKLVWEVLEHGLKKKIEIQWSDVAAIRATFGDDQSSVLEVELANLPAFSREIDPYPRKHTNWQTSHDFTNGEASTYRRHYLEFPKGTLQKHYEKLLCCDGRLCCLNLGPFPIYPSPYFNPAQEIQEWYSSENCYPPQVPQYDRAISTHHLMGKFDGLGSQPVSSYSPLPVTGLNRGIKSLNSPNSVMDFPPNKEQVAFGMDPRILCSVNNLPTASLCENTTVPCQGLQSFKNANAIEEKNEELPLNAYATPAPSFNAGGVSTTQYPEIPERISLIDRDLQFLEDILLNDDEQCS